MANYLFETFNPNIKVVFAQDQAKKSDGFLPHRTLVQDISKLKKLGWEPKTNLKRIYEIDIERFSQC